MTSIKANLLALGFVVLAGTLEAAPGVWDGGGNNGFFSTATNWEDNVTPLSGSGPLSIGANTGVIPFIAFDSGNFLASSFTFLSNSSLYTVTAAASGSDFLTLTNTGVALLNLSSFRQTFSGMTTNVAATTQTWNGGAQGLVFGQIDLDSDHTLTFDGTGTTSTTRNEIAGKISGTLSSGVTKAGTGTLLFNSSQPSEYFGATTLLNGKLQLGSSNQIPDTSKLVLSGGIFDTGGFSDTMGTLLLDGNVTLELGAGSSELFFADSRLEAWMPGTQLNILNYTAGVDSLRIGTSANALTAGQISQITINGFAATMTSTGFLVPVPEPGVSALLVGAGVFALSRRRRTRGTAD